MRRLSLNLLTGSVAVALLVALALPARHVLRAADPAPPAAPTARTFGVFVDPWHVDDWARDIGAAPQMVAKFEAFSRRRPLAPFLAEAHSQGIRQVMVQNYY